jgi:3' terminal RNA ribose 2'-O-methyltransferase Hen1
VATILRDRDVATVVDLGCGEGKLIQRLLRERALTRIVGVDASPVALERAGRRLRVEEWSERQKERTQLLFGSALYGDARLAGIDAVVCVEVIEHLELDRLPLFEQVLFEHLRPRVVVVTTPNRLYNVRYGLEDGVWRHSDHRFEWSRAQFAAWVDGVVSRGGYRAELGWIGDVDPELGAPTQSVVFEREAS